MNPQEKTAHTFRFTFRNSLKQNFILALLGICGIAGAGLVQLVYSFRKGLLTTTDAATGLTQLRESIKFQLFFSSVTASLSTAAALGCLVLAIAALLGISLFHFTQNSKRFECYCALGVSREGMLWSRLLAGLVLLSIAVIVPIVLLLGINLVLFGSCALLWNAALYAAGSLLLVGFFTLGVVALAFGSVGVLSQALAFSGLLLLTPDLLLTAFERLGRRLVPGVSAIYSTTANSLIPGEISPTLLSSDILPELYSPLRFFLLYFRPSLSQPSIFFTAEPSPIPFRPLLGFALLAAGIFALATLVFHRRRPELCGVPGYNRLLNFFGINVLGIGALSLLYPEEYPFATLPPKQFSALLALCAYAMIYLLAQLFLQRSFKKTLRELWKLPLHLAVGGLTLLIFSNGLLGYAAHSPRLQAVESVSLQPMTDFPLLAGRYYSGEALSYTVPTLQENARDYTLTFLAGHPVQRLNGVRDPAQIQKVMDLQREIAAYSSAYAKGQAPKDAAPRDVHILFVYQLKTGGSVARFFGISSDALIEKLALLQNELVTPLYDTLLQAPEPRNDSLNSFRHSLYDPDVGIVLQSRFLDKVLPIRLSAAQRQALADALRKDLTAQSAEQRLFPQKPALALLRLETFDGTHSDAELLERVLTQTAGTRNGEVISQVQSLIGNLIVTEDMVHTLQFLRTEKLLEQLQPELRLIRARVTPLQFSKPYRSLYNGRPNPADTASYEFMGMFQTIDHDRPVPSIFKDFESYPCDYAPPPQDFFTTTDDALIAELAQNAHLKHFISRGGYIVEFETEKDAFVTLFVPADKLPQEIAKEMLP